MTKNKWHKIASRQVMWLLQFYENTPYPKHSNFELFKFKAMFGFFLTLITVQFCTSYFNEALITWNPISGFNLGIKEFH